MATTKTVKKKAKRKASPTRTPTRGRSKKVVTKTGKATTAAGAATTTSVEPTKFKRPEDADDGETDQDDENI